MSNMIILSSIRPLSSAGFKALCTLAVYWEDNGLIVEQKISKKPIDLFSIREAVAYYLFRCILA